MSRINDTKQLWIKKGYEHFALFGPEKLSINKISKEIESSRASFYHHFGDIEVFIEELLDIHWQINQQFCSTGVLECKKLFPDLYLLLEQYPIPFGEMRMRMKLLKKNYCQLPVWVCGL